MFCFGSTKASPDARPKEEVGPIKAPSPSGASPRPTKVGVWFRVRGFGFKFGFRVRGFGSTRRPRKVWGLGFEVQGARRRVQASKVQASGFAGRLFKVQSAVLAVQVLGFGVWC